MTPKTPPYDPQLSETIQDGVSPFATHRPQPSALPPEPPPPRHSPPAAPPTLSQTQTQRITAGPTTDEAQILRMVAHDLRNPLNLVSVSASLLKRLARQATEHPSDRPIDPARIAHSASLLELSVQRMKRLIDDLIDSEAISQGTLSLRPAPCDLSEIAKMACLTMSPRAEEAQVQLDLEVSPASYAFHGDADRIAQIFENLLGNAIKFTPAGAKVTLSLKAKPDDFRIEIADQGPGIDSHAFERLFQAYYRGERPQGSGLGLGLSIVLGLVRAHDGAIWPGRNASGGATFTVTFPRHTIRRDTVLGLQAYDP